MSDVTRAWLRTMLAAEVNRTGQSSAVVRDAAKRLREIMHAHFRPKAFLAVLLAAAEQELDALDEAGR